MTAVVSNPLPARSDGLENVDGGPDAAFYIQMRVIEQVFDGVKSQEKKHSTFLLVGTWTRMQP
jgi:hypothetical protein